MIVHKKQDGINPVVAAVAGVAAATVVGAGIAVALNDKKSREKVKDVLSSAKDQVIDFVEILKIKPTIGEGINKIKKITADTKKAGE